MYYSDEIIDEVISRNDIVNVISGYVSLKRKGSTYEACCPFHHEKTPSFKVDREKQLYHCFGCGAGGNVFTFIMEYENLSFPEAVQYLAEKAGMTLPESSQTGADASKEKYKMVLREMNRTAAAYFHYLMKHTEHGKKRMTISGAEGCRKKPSISLDWDMPIFTAMICTGICGTRGIQTRS